jgi:hypothetical protein
MLTRSRQKTRVRMTYLNSKDEFWLNWRLRKKYHLFELVCTHTGRGMLVWQEYIYIYIEREREREKERVCACEREETHMCQLLENDIMMIGTKYYDYISNKNKSYVRNESLRSQRTFENCTIEEVQIRNCF